MTTEEFIVKARAVHGDKYDYSKVEYVNSYTKVCIICPEHGEFWQRPNDHLSAKGCVLCGHIRMVEVHSVWTKNMCYNEAKKYKSRGEFSHKSPYAYHLAKKNNWLNEYSWLIELHKPNGYWTHERCYEEAKKYHSRREFQKGCNSAYLVANHNNWLNEYKWFEKLRVSPWTYEICFKEAKKYTLLKDFRTKSPSAYARAIKSKWLSDYSWLVPANHHPWTFDECFREAKKYKTKKEFLQNSPRIYKASLKRKWIEQFYWLKDDRVLLFTDKIDNVYIYLFEETNAIYVGRTIRPTERDKEHVFNSSLKDSVALYALKHHIAVPQMQIIEDNLTIEQGLTREDYWIHFYQQQGYTILNKAKTGIGLGSLGSIGACKWNKNSCLREASKYKSRSEFQDKCGSAYDVARKNGWLVEYTWMKEPLQKLEDRWNFEECALESRKYKTRDEFCKGSRGAYRLALRNKWINAFIWLKRPPKKDKKWTYETCYAEAKKYSSIAKFVENNGGAYNVALKNGWLKDYVWFTPLHKPNGYWTYKACYEEAKKYTSRKEFEEGCSTAYNRALNNKWINDYTWFDNTVNLLRKPKKWNHDTCREAALKCTSRGDFGKKYPGAWIVAKKMGWMKDYTWFREKKKTNGYWTYERCKTEALKYKTRFQFFKAQLGAYTKSRKEGWLDEFYPKNDNKHEED